MNVKKLYRVKEVYRVTGYTYVFAESEEEAQERLENGEGDFKEEDFDHYDTKWETFGEAPKRKAVDL